MAFNRRKKTVIIALVVVGLIAIIGLSRVFKKREGEPVQVGKVERRTQLVSKVTASGEVRPVTIYNLTAEVPGRVEAIYVTEGQVVKKGQPLVKVDPTQTGFAVSAGEASVRVSQADVQNQQVALDQARNNVNQSKANLAAAEADLERLKADLNYAESEYKRNEELVEKGVINKSQFESVKSRYEQARASVNAQLSRINQIKVQIKDAELAVNRAEAALNSSQQRVQ